MRITSGTQRMVTFLYVVVPYIVVLYLITLVGCAGDAEPEITAGIDACQTCNMVIDRVEQACGYRYDGGFVPFDSPACLLSAYQALPRPERPAEADIFFADYRNGELRITNETTFLLTNHIPTVMNGRVICFASRDAAVAASGHADEVVTGWFGYYTIRGEPDRRLEVLIGPEGMVPETVAADKGELVALKITGLDLDDDIPLTVGGYPEVGTVVVPASGEPVEFRLLALLPGEGFPLLAAGGDRPLGKLRVTGAHTTDEEAQ